MKGPKGKGQSEAWEWEKIGRKFQKRGKGDGRKMRGRRKSMLSECDEERDRRRAR